ncbi:hypothetical protein Q4Q39_09970 [Flavivirga amylovorans]|uniref:Uncharacterized protein n=1 Tax=Flavivirga amylovorans TaxID=870486 RepID=A0ABT8X194_9FLAO|nr:hypothetical protein [Flavivirga amylovorans]MDO5987724.1 hypothetical protein [Flavivirga amylovorans]
MKHFFKTPFITVLFLGSLLSCSSDETTTETTSDEKISSSLINKIIETAASTNDIDIINFECDREVTLVGHFINNQGDYYGPFNTPLPKWDERILSSKEHAFSMTGIKFTNDDYFIDLIFDFNGGFGILQSKENMIDYFQDCSFEGDIKFFPEIGPITVSEINYSCSGKAKYYIDVADDDVYITNDPIPLSGGINAVEEALLAHNTANNSTYSLDELRINSVEFISPGGTTSFAIGKPQMVNYFEDCVLDRNTNDCINFTYPLVMNKINLQTDEIVPITITNDSELTQDFFDQFENLTIVYPITLRTLNYDIIVVESNEELENVLTDSATFCTDDDW